MSWKSIDMQIALPRTHDAGRIQEQIQQRGQFIQDMLVTEHIKSEEIKRRAVNDLHQKDHMTNQNEQKSQTNQHVSKAKHDQIEEQEFQIKHPYLGNKIDFNG